MAGIESFPNDDLLSSDAQYFDYSSAANPIQQGIIPPVPYRTFSPSFFDEGPTRVQPLDVGPDAECRDRGAGDRGCRQALHG